MRTVEATYIQSFLLSSTHWYLLSFVPFQFSELGCSTEIETGNSINAFADVLLNYTIDSTRSEWQRTYSPGCLVGDVCVEFEQVPNEVKCDQKPEENNFRRFCNCINASKPEVTQILKTSVGFAISKSLPSLFVPILWEKLVG